MEGVLVTILPYISTSALPVVIVVIGCFYIYRKIGNDRKITKDERDKDSQELHDKVEKATWEISNIKNEQVLHRQLIEDFRTQLSTLTTEVAKLSVCIDNLRKFLEKK